VTSEESEALSPRWRQIGTCPLSIVDGGDCVWQIRHNIKTRAFSHFDVNGEA
jgi:hypothetical protein